MLDLSIAILFTLLAIVGWGANVLGLPGNWLIVCLALGSWLLVPESYRSHVTQFPVIVVGLFAIVGEVLEFAASALGASRLGGSRRGTVLAILGSIAGAVLGLFFGVPIPIPIIGSLIASLLLGASGAFLGAVAGERWAGKDWAASLQIGNAAFWGRLLGTVGKAVCGTIACGMFLSAIWL